MQERICTQGSAFWAFLSCKLNIIFSTCPRKQKFLRGKIRERTFKFNISLRAQIFIDQVSSLQILRWRRPCSISAAVSISCPVEAGLQLLLHSFYRIIASRTHRHSIFNSPKARVCMVRGGGGGGGGRGKGKGGGCKLCRLKFSTFVGCR